MADTCPLCNGVLKEKRGDGYEKGYDCPQCGRFIMSPDTKDHLPYLCKMAEGNESQEEKLALLSHALRKMQRPKYWALLDGQLVERLLKSPRPSLTEQVNNLILWLGDTIKYGERVNITASCHLAIVGALTAEGFRFIVKHLFDSQILTGQFLAAADRAASRVTLSFEGWQYYEELKRGAVDSRKAFMAMQYRDEELEQIVDLHFKPAVAETGFELYTLDEQPKAGLIDDRLRVEIRTSRFLISDLTHENPGAYWEAGYAEGLGKPVIYTCKKKKFESDKTHFDTNHHLTVIWDENAIQKAVADLKATIRATLPDEAKLTDQPPKS